ncbi:hypothetical protein, partial [Luteibacter sp.]|uniref:hypothetical protein n=1 Tax=Luteibacter sp. TaxID=1886636 RepID=UPI003F802C33
VEVCGCEAVLPTKLFASIFMGGFHGYEIIIASAQPAQASCWQSARQPRRPRGHLGGAEHPRWPTNSPAG